MKVFAYTLICACALLALNAGPAAAQELDPHLAAFQDIVGKTWKGRLSAPDAEKESWDVSRWERALNGKAIRILHSVDDGAYGGETLLYWNSKTEQIEFFYLTTAGFHTQGTMEIQDGKFVAFEEVTGEVQGITAVRSTSEFMEDGRLRGISEYLKNGEWVPGHTIVYEEAPDASPVFR